MELTIAATWDGARLPTREHVSVALIGEADALRIEVAGPYLADPPPAGPPGPTDRLWEHEVVEVFVAGPAHRYTEIELGPHGHHLVLRLDGVRRIVERDLPIEFEATIEAGRWRGVARVPRAWLPAGPHRVNAYAIHGQGSSRRYLAMTPLPGNEPDFHQPDRFAPLQLP